MLAPRSHVDNSNWRFSRRCDGGACVMVGHQEGSIVVGNAAQPDGPYIAYTVAAWRNFLLGIRQGAFDPRGDA
jgi:hypothetical protein